MPPARHDQVSRSEPELAGGELGALYAGADLGKRCLAAGGGVITERGEAAVIAGAEPARFDVDGGFQHPVPDVFGRLYSWVDRVDDANENPLPWPGVLGDGAQDPGT